MYSYSLYWWLVERLSGENRVSIKVAKMCPLFNGQNLSSKVVIWIHCWPNDVSKIIVHGIDRSSSLSVHINAGISTTEDVEYESLIDVLPNPSLRAVKTNSKCDRHDWRVSISVPTQSSFMLPIFYRDFCVINDGLVYTNGFSVKFIAFIFDAANDDEEFQNSSTAVREENGRSFCCGTIKSESLDVSCVYRSTMRLDKARFLNCLDCFPLRNDARHPNFCYTRTLGASESDQVHYFLFFRC